MAPKKPLETLTMGAGIVFIGLIISKILGFIYRLIVARMGTDQYGLLSLGLAIYGIFVIISLLGTNEGVLRYVSYYKGKKDENRIKGTIYYPLKLTSIISIILAVLIFILSDFLAFNVFNDPRLSLVLKILAFAIPFDVIRSILHSVSRAYKKIQYEVISKNIVENVFKVMFTFIFILLGFELVGATMAYVFSILVSFLTIVITIEKRVFSFLDKKIRAIYNKKQLLTYSIPLVFNTLILLAISWTDTITLGIFKTASQVGIYNAALPIANLLYIFPSAILALLLPVLTDLYIKKEEKDFSFTYVTVTKWIFLINLLMLSIFLLFPKKILFILFGTDYVSGYIVLIILSITNFIYYLSITCNNILLVYEKTKTISFISLIGAIVNIVLNIILIPTYNILGAAIATGISLVIMAFIFYYLSFRTSKINQFNFPYLKIILSLTISSTLVYYLIQLLKNVPTLAVIIIGSFTLFTIYFLIMLLTKSFDEKDLIVLRFIKNKAGIKVNFLNKIIRRFI